VFCANAKAIAFLSRNAFRAAPLRYHMNDWEIDTKILDGEWLRPFALGNDDAV